MVLDYLALENRIIKLEIDLLNLKTHLDIYEDDIDQAILEIESRLIKIEKGDTHGNR